MKERCFFLLSLALALTVLIFAARPGRAADPETGWAFTDPSEQAPVPKGWEDHPIQYDKQDADADIVMSLDQHLYPMLLPIISDYAKEHHLKVIVKEGTCGISNGKLFSKEIDVGGFCCPPGRLDRLPGLSFHTLGIAALAIMVNPGNPVENLTSDEVRKMYKGELVRWVDVHDPGAKKEDGLPIQPVTRLHCKLRPGGWRLILPSENLFSPNIHDVSSIPDMIAELARNKKAIGYEVAWNALYHYRDKGKVKIISVDGISPFNDDALLQGRYPFYRTYNITTWTGKRSANPKADALVKYLREHINSMDKQYGIVPWPALKKAGWRFQGDELIGVPEK